MTESIYRAAEVIHDTVQEWPQDDVAGVASRRLADAGLLTPDLPEPHTFPNGEKEWYTPDGWVNLDTDGTITVVYDERDEDDIAAGAEIEPGELVFTRVREARALACALLAAADHAEGVGRADA